MHDKKQIAFSFLQLQVEILNYRTNLSNFLISLVQELHKAATHDNII